MKKIPELRDLPIWRDQPPFICSDRPLARYIGLPARKFLRIESAGGVVLLIATAIALIWANSPWGGTYTELWETDLGFTLGGFTLEETLAHWVNDGLMALFFFVVGMEIKSEIVSGELRSPAKAITPIAGAAGGMIVPAAVYAAFNASNPETAHGWGIPMATDIAFALGVIAFFATKIPAPARVFLLTLAIVDDLGAITVIAVFYTENVSLPWLTAAGVVVVLLIIMRMMRVWAMPIYLILGLTLWLCMLESGVHATIAGVIMGLFISAKPLLDRHVARDYAQQIAAKGPGDGRTRRLIILARESDPPAERIQARLHPFSSFVVLPLFALANAGIPLSGDIVSHAVTSPVTLGILFGLVVGKTVGVFGFSWLAITLKLGSKPDNTSWSMMLGLSIVAGIGFTVALFITELAFRGGDSELFTDEAKIGVLVGSIVAALLGALVLHLSTRNAPVTAAANEDKESGPEVRHVRDIIETAQAAERTERTEAERGRSVWDENALG
ncbi:Na+/H+ antiporter NhaA [Haloglycomyces albus]|uniref:Na+/H+ antiporter NhaA n=1 Tax=Haloglycomyces albus TaxID=526067 RepID=UPI0004B92995|nr:Na+/H+ antiporter NhaA [Haloglycomyces albus]